MIDVAFALVLVLGIVFGAKRGLFRSFMALAAILIALIGASLLTDLLTEPVTELLMPRAEKGVEEWFRSWDENAEGEIPQPSEHSPAAEGEGGSVLTEPAVSDGEEEGEYASPLAVTGLLKQLLHFDLDGPTACLSPWSICPASSTSAPTLPPSASSSSARATARWCALPASTCWKAP